MPPNKTQKVWVLKIEFNDIGKLVSQIVALYITEGTGPKLVSSSSFTFALGFVPFKTKKYSHSIFTFDITTGQEDGEAPTDRFYKIRR